MHGKLKIIKISEQKTVKKEAMGPAGCQISPLGLKNSKLKKGMKGVLYDNYKDKTLHALFQ
jgi:hypothetical protein